MFSKGSGKAGIMPHKAIVPPKSSGAAIDFLALVTGMAVAAIGGGQLVAPFATASLSGLGDSIASQILAVQWLFFAALLLFGGAAKVRVVTIFAAEFLMIGSLAALTITLYNEPGSIAPFVHGAIAIFAFACSGFARLTDKADLKHELRLMREQASIPSPANSTLANEPASGNPNE